MASLSHNMNTISLYAILRDSDNKFFGGFDPTKGEAILVDNAIGAKLFSNKFDINLRPDERMVEVVVSLSDFNTKVTAPFKPRRRADRMDGPAPSKAHGQRITDA